MPPIHCLPLHPYQMLTPQPQNSSRTSSKTSTASWSKSQHTTPWASQAKKSYPKKCKHHHITIRTKRPPLLPSNQKLIRGGKNAANLSPPPSKASTSPPPLHTSSPPCPPNCSSTSKTAATRTFTRASLSSWCAAATSSCAASRAPLRPFATCSPSRCPLLCRSCVTTWQRCWRRRAVRLGRVAAVGLVIFLRGLRQPCRVDRLAASEGRELV